MSKEYTLKLIDDLSSNFEVVKNMLLLEVIDSDIFEEKIDIIKLDQIRDNIKEIVSFAYCDQTGEKIFPGDPCVYSEYTLRYYKDYASVYANHLQKGIFKSDDDLLQAIEGFDVYYTIYF